MADRTVAGKFGSFLLDSTNGIGIRDWDNRLLKDTSWKSRLQGDGALVTKDRLTSHQVRVGGIVTGTDTGALRDNMDALISALSNGEDYLQLYSDRRLLCRLDGAVKYEFGPVAASMEWSVKFRSRWPYWEDPVAVNRTFTNTTGAGPHTLQTTAAVGGTAPTFPVITILSNITLSNRNILVTNTATMEQINLIGVSMNAGQEIRVDMREGWLGDGIASAVTPFAVEGTWFSWASGAVATIEISHNQGGTADWDFELDHTPNYWTT